MSNPPSRLATGSHARFLLCLLALATVLRALVPVGYMPDAAALRQGRLQISFCSAAGGPPSVMTALMDARAPSPAMSDMSAMSDPRDGGHAGQADDAAQECPFWMVAHQTLDLPPLPYLPALPAAAVASVAAGAAVPAAAARGRPAAGAARPACPVPGLIARSARARALFRPPYPPPAFRRLAPHSRSTTRARASARARPSDMQRQRRTVMQNPSFDFPAPWRWPRPWPPSFPPPAPSRRPPSTWIRWSSPPSRPIRR